jgi:hypothetical protein
MPQNLLILDITDRRIRYALLESNFRRSELVALHEVDIAGLSAEEKAERWSTLRQGLPRKLDSVVVGNHPHASSVRLLNFPFKDARKVEAAIDFELEGQTPYDLADIAVSKMPLERDVVSEHSSLLVAITPKKIFNERIKFLTDLDLEPRALVVSDASLAELVETPPGETVGIMSVDEDAIHLAICRGELRFVRTLRPFGSDTTQLFSQLQATFKALPHADLPSKLFVTGSITRNTGFVEVWEKQLGIPIEVINLRTAAAVLGDRIEVIPAEFGITIAMALAVFRHGNRVPLNFRQGSLAYQGDIQLYRSTLVRVAYGFAIVSLLAMGSLFVRLTTIRAEEKKLDLSFCAATKKIIGKEICDPTAASASVKQAPGSSVGIYVPPFSATVMFDMLSRALEPTMDVSFDDLEFRVPARPGEAAKISGKGEAVNFDITEQLVTSIRRDPCVQTAEASKQRKKPNSDRVEFNLAIELTCPGDMLPGDKLAGVSEAAGSSAPPPVPNVVPVIPNIPNIPEPRGVP